MSTDQTSQMASVTQEKNEELEERVEPEPEVEAETSSPAADPEADDSSTSENDNLDHLVSFDGHEHLRRGVRLGRIMRGAGKIFKNSKGSSKTYELSQKVETIDFFISHNWAIHWGLKYLALAFKFNMHLAILAGFTTLGLGILLSVTGVLPTLNSKSHDYPTGFVCRIVTIPVMLLTLLFGGRISSRVKPRSDPVVFLDKACIHQADPELQQAGICRLGAFLRVSDKMLVLLSEVYLRKLWTVYEVASFLSLHDMTRLEVVPIMLPFSLVLFVALVYHYQFFMIAMNVLGLPSWGTWIANLCGSLVYVYCSRIWARSKVQLEETITNFSVRNAECAVESDRLLVYGNIAALQKASGRVSRTSTSDEALEAFDELVRQSLAHLFKDVFGRFSYSHSEYLMVGMAAGAAVRVDYWAQVGAGQPWREAIGERCMDAGLDLVLVPVWALCLEVAANQYLTPRANGFKDLTYIFVANAVVSIVGNGFQELQIYWGQRAKHSDAWLVGAIFFEVFLFVGSYFLFRRVGSLHRSDRRLERQSLPISKASANTRHSEPEASKTPTLATQPSLQSARHEDEDDDETETVEEAEVDLVCCEVYSV